MIRTGWRMLASLTAYFLVAQLGMRAIVGDGLISTVWPATGIAMALLWRHGLWLWPAIALGELLSSTLGGWSLGAASASMAGNTLDAVVGVLLLRRFGFSGRFTSVADVPRFVAGPMVACTISATLGVLGLAATGLAPWTAFATLWTTWWGSAVVGTLFVMPVLLAATEPDGWSLPRAKLPELAAFALLAALGFAVTVLRAPQNHSHEHAFFVFAIVLLAWPSVRLGLFWATLTTLVLAAAMTGATHAGLGPFVSETPEPMLLLLQTFIGTVSVVTLTVAAALRELDLTAEQIRREKEMAEEANRAKAAFLATMSHELRTPLNAILGFSEVLSTKALAPVLSDPAKVSDYGSLIHQAGSKLLNLINDLLDLSKIEAGKLELAEDDIALDAVVEDCLSIIRHYPNGAAVTLPYVPGGEGWVLRSDQRRVQQILLNLLSNAVKFTPEGGSVCIRTAVIGQCFQIRVSDTGLGMTAEQIAKALTPFAQIDNPLTRKHEGTGLGLPLAEQLARQLGGTLRLASQPGRGTTAIVEFPADMLTLPEAVSGKGEAALSAACEPQP